MTALVPATTPVRTPVRTPALYDAVVGHTRRPVHGSAVGNAFAYRVYLWLVDLDHLPVLPRGLRWLARFEARDHLGAPDRSIRENVEAFLAGHGIDLAGGRILMLAHARVAGYVFNPISVHWCYRPSGDLACIVAEVHNTYRGRHAYLLRPDAAGRAEANKAFYVSPFLTVDGRYLMRFSPPGDRLTVTMTLRQEGATPFSATLSGTAGPAGLGRVVLASLRRPFMPQRVSALIRWQGIRLWWRRLPVVTRTHDNGGLQ